jgi:hypothetical protein
MRALNTFTITYKRKEYIAAEIPHIFINKTDERIIIGSHSLNVALYDDERGYPDAEAQYVDEQIYAFIDDDFFKLNYNDFIQKAKQYLD